MKKVLSLLLAVTVILSFAGCQNKQASSDNVETITYWTYNSHDKDLMTKIIDEFNSTEGAKLGVKINYVIKSDMSSTMIDLGYASAFGNRLLHNTVLLIFHHLFIFNLGKKKDYVLSLACFFNLNVDGFVLFSKINSF